MNTILSKTCFILVLALIFLSVGFSKQQSSVTNTFNELCGYDVTKVGGGGALASPTPDSTYTDLFMCLVMCNQQTSCVIVTVNTVSSNCSLYSIGSFMLLKTSASSNVWKKPINGVYPKYSVYASGLTHYWPVQNSLNVNVATAQSATSTSPLFVTDRYGNPTGAFGCKTNSSGSFWTVPAGVYFAGDFTLTFWAKIYTYKQWSRILDFGNGYPNGGSDNIDFHSNSATFSPAGTYGNNYGIGIVPQPPSSNHYGTNTNLPSNYTVQLNVWNYVGVTASGGTVIIYQNGTRITSQSGQPVPQNISRSTNNFCRNTQSGANFLDVDIDDVKIFSRALSAAEISSDYGV